ncbi:MAG: peptidylprolyl isomerase [Nitrospiraceae bacterium]|nr:peptidylprolyl isomerase [Nitrospiraceae bacterium]
MATASRSRCAAALAALTPLFALALVLPGCGRARANGPTQVLARVDGTEITVSAFERQVRDLPRAARKLVEGAGGTALLNSMIDRELLYQEAKKKGLDEDPDIKGRIEDTEKDVLANALIERETAGKTRVGDGEARLYYNSHPSEFRDVREVRISRIVVPDEKNAARLLAGLRKGADFGRLAAMYSADRRSAARGGDMGYFAYGQLPARIRDAVFGSKKKAGGRNAVFRVFRTGAGYGIYRITDRRTVNYPFDKIKGALERRLADLEFEKAVQNLVSRLRKGAKIEVNRAVFRSGPAGRQRR